MLRERGVDLWVVLTRESTRDPIAEHFHAGTAVGRMAIAIRPTEHDVELSAVCASYDLAPLEDSRLYTSIQPYGPEGWQHALAAMLPRGGRGRIAVNMSPDEPIADGLTVSMKRELLLALGDGGAERLVSSEPFVNQLFSRKTAWETERIRDAAVRAEGILRLAMSRAWIQPGHTTERMLAEVIASEVHRAGASFAWERTLCPSVQAGTTRGHAAPGERVIGAGELVAVDFGIGIDGYVSDLQRSLFAGRRADIPHDLQHLWDTTHAAVQAAVRVMRPGVTGLEVDGAARAIIHRGGYADYIHATGHPLGYVVHDVGPMLGPNWPGRYGNRVHQEIERDMVFTVEPAAAAPKEEGLLRIGLEEDVVIRETGAEFLAPPQTELWTLEP
jgi:Xaa-Pro aminopeptidase